MQLPTITKKFIRHIKRKAEKRPEKLFRSVTPPSEEMIKRLNRIGQEYPFCVYHKQRLMNDPL
jgi:hypothetical protein